MCWCCQLDWDLTYKKIFQIYAIHKQQRVFGIKKMCSDLESAICTEIFGTQIKVFWTLIDITLLWLLCTLTWENNSSGLLIQLIFNFSRIAFHCTVLYVTVWFTLLFLLDLFYSFKISYSFCFFMCLKSNSFNFNVFYNFWLFWDVFPFFQI